MTRVVITGCGVLSSIGNNVEEFIDSIKAGKNGIDEITYFDTTNYKTKLAAELKNYDPKAMGLKGIKKKDPFIQYGILAAREAFKNSGYEINSSNEFDTGVIVSSGVGGLNTMQEEDRKNYDFGPKKMSSHFITKNIINMASGFISIDLGTRGICSSVVTACASGTDSIGTAYRLIKDGYQKAVLAGGCEAAICDIGIGGFEAMSALSFSQDKNRASIPFDKERNGFVMGEGAGVVMLESLESALERNANIICEVVSYATYSDSYHITSPDPEAIGIEKAMEKALIDAGLCPSDIDYINAHGTSTSLNDKTESKAIREIIGDDVMVSSTKSMTGHMLGASGAVEAIVCAYALKEGFVPSTINYKEKDEECPLDYVVEGTRYEDIKYAMSNSLGFGGHNSTLIFKKYEA